MNFQPTRLARIIEESRAQTQVAPGAAMMRNADKAVANPDPPRRRARLAELNSHIHCSVIGTCLSTSELRKLVPRFKEVDRERATDVEIHHAAVELAGEGGAGSKALHKALDERHELAIKRFREAKSENDLRRSWQECLANGEIPGAYWAVMTHPGATAELRGSIFGEVHMLSHLVGAANRADIRRLLALEQENGELKDKASRQQQRLQEMSAAHQRENRLLRERAAWLSASAGRGEENHSADLVALIDELKSALAAKERALAHQTRRRENAEQGLEHQLQTTRALNSRLAHALALTDALSAEAGALEHTLVRHLESSVAEGATSEFLEHKRVIYVGGRPGSNRAIKTLVENAGGELLVHDGGIEDRKGLLAAALPAADLVVFPVDCIDHDSMSTLKRVCERYRVPFHALRSASIASFSSLIAELALPPSEPAAAARGPHFCLRHC
jgi:hypothetical protein